MCMAVNSAHTSFERSLSFSPTEPRMEASTSGSTEGEGVAESAEGLDAILGATATASAVAFCSKVARRLRTL